MIKQRNDSGLTIKEWCAANGIQGVGLLLPAKSVEKMAWIACETPGPTKDQDSSGTFVQISALLLLYRLQM